MSLRKSASPGSSRAVLDDAATLSSFGGWKEGVYRDLLAVQAGAMTIEAFDARYRRREAILVLDFKGFTENAVRAGSVQAFLRILNAHKVLIPVLSLHGAERVHAFADDLVAIFRNPGDALDAAIDIHGRTREQEADPATPEGWPECCIGIGWGLVYAIGPNLAMGDEMNRASKLGEDLARGGETLLTEQARDAMVGRDDVSFERQSGADLAFPHYRVVDSDAT